MILQDIIKQINFTIPNSISDLKEGIFVTGTVIDGSDHSYYYEIPVVLDSNANIDIIKTNKKIIYMILLGDTINRPETANAAYDLMQSYKYW